MSAPLFIPRGGRLNSTLRVGIRTAGAVAAIALGVTSMGVGAEEPAAAPAPAKKVQAPFEVKIDRMLTMDATQIGKRFVAVGERGRIMLSDDDGKSWKPAQSPTEKTLTSVMFVNEKVGFVTGHEGVILRTEDGGTTWKSAEVKSENPESVFGVMMIDEQNGMAYGGYAMFLETSDGGKTWTQRKLFGEDFDSHLTGMVRTGPESFAMSGERGTVALSKDRGRTWELAKTPYDGSFYGIVQARNGALVVFGMRGNVYRSPDGGKTWSKVDLQTSASIIGGQVYPNGDIYLFGNEGLIASSRDDGQSFVWRKMPDRRVVSQVLVNGGGRGLVFGESGFSWLSTNFWR